MPPKSTVLVPPENADVASLLVQLPSTVSVSPPAASVPLVNVKLPFTTGLMPLCSVTVPVPPIVKLFKLLLPLGNSRPVVSAELFVYMTLIALPLPIVGATPEMLPAEREIVEPLAMVRPSPELSPKAPFVSVNVPSTVVPLTPLVTPAELLMVRLLKVVAADPPMVWALLPAKSTVLVPPENAVDELLLVQLPSTVSVSLPAASVPLVNVKVPLTVGLMPLCNVTVEPMTLKLSKLLLPLGNPVLS